MRILDIAFTGYCVTDMKKAREFYEGLLGLTEARTFGDGAAFEWIEYDIGSGTLAVIKSDGKDWLPSSQGAAIALEVDDVDGFATRLKEAGATIVFDVFESPLCRTLVAADPDGNKVVLHKRKAG